jgi:hypothetical protein
VIYKNIPSSDFNFSTFLERERETDRERDTHTDSTCTGIDKRWVNEEN